MITYTRTEVCDMLARQFPDVNMTGIFEQKSDYWLRCQFRKEGIKLMAAADKFYFSYLN